MTTLCTTKRCSSVSCYVQSKIVSFNVQLNGVMLIMPYDWHFWHVNTKVELSEILVSFCSFSHVKTGPFLHEGVCFSVTETTVVLSLITVDLDGMYLDMYRVVPPGSRILLWPKQTSLFECSVR